MMLLMQTSVPIFSVPILELDLVKGQIGIAKLHSQNSLKNLLWPGLTNFPAWANLLLVLSYTTRCKYRVICEIAT